MWNILTHRIYTLIMMLPLLELRNGPLSHPNVKVRTRWTVRGSQKGFCSNQQIMCRVLSATSIFAKFQFHRQKGHKKKTPADTSGGGKKKVKWSISSGEETFVGRQCWATPRPRYQIESFSHWAGRNKSLLKIFLTALPGSLNILSEAWGCFFLYAIIYMQDGNTPAVLQPAEWGVTSQPAG